MRQWEAELEYEAGRWVKLHCGDPNGSSSRIVLKPSCSCLSFQRVVESYRECFGGPVFFAKGEGRGE